MDTDKNVIGPINLGNPNEFTIKQLAEKVIELTGSNSKLTIKSLPQDDPKQQKPYITLVRYFRLAT
jgi:UDP-glucuronate decarboxylase